MMEQIQAAISVKKADDSTKILLTSGKTSETSVLGIRCKKECLSSSFNDVDEIEEANMDGVDISSRFDRNDQGKEEEEIKKDEDFEKPASKKLKPLSAQLQCWSGVGEVGDEYYENYLKKFMLIKLDKSDNDMKPFQGHLIDPELADLRFVDKPTAEEHVKQQ